jgi:hypothetical protein
VAKDLVDIEIQGVDMQASVTVLLVFVVSSSILAVIHAYFENKGMKHDFFSWAWAIIPIYIYFIFGLLHDFNNYISHIQVFSLLLLFFEQGGIIFFSRNVVRKQLSSEKSLGPFYSYLTPIIFIPFVFSLFSLLNYLSKFMTISSNASTIALYLCHIITRVFIWTWKFMVLRKLSHLSLGETD